MASQESATAESSPDVPLSGRGTEGLSAPWYTSGFGLAIVALDVLLTVALALATTRTVDVGIESVASAGLGTVPAHVYGFSLLGALGFVFTALIERFDSDTERLIRYNFRLPAAIPLGAGVFLLSDVILGTSATTGPIVLGVVFLSGLYVNLAYKRLGALARRLLPESSSGTDSSGSESDSTGRSTPSSDSTTSGGASDGRIAPSDGGTSTDETTHGGDGASGSDDGERDLEPEAPRRS